MPQAPAPAADALPAPDFIPLRDVAGHQRPIATLNAALASGRFHHAWLFHGPPGIGKCTTALACAALLLDPDARPDDLGRVVADDDSATARMIRAGTHPGLHYICKELASFSRDPRVRERKQRVIPLEVLREFLIERAARTAHLHTGARAEKVFIIDQAELINEAGQNALLKTLEEPPPATVFFLISQSPGRLLPTIRSRCQRLAFSPLPPDTLARWLDRRGLRLSPRQLELLPRVAEGSPGRALLAVRTGIIDWPDTLDPFLDDLRRGKFPVLFASTAAALVDQWAKDWVRHHPGASKEAANHAGADHLFHIIAAHFRDALAHTDPHAPDALRSLRAIELLDQAHRLTQANVQLLFVLEDWAAAVADDPTTP